MRGHDREKRLDAGSSNHVKIEDVFEQFLRFCRNATIGPSGEVPWPLNSVRKFRNPHLNPADQCCSQKTQFVEKVSNFDDVTGTGARSSSSNSESDELSSQNSDSISHGSDIIEPTSDIPEKDQVITSSSSHFEQILHLSNVGLRPDEMSPPSESIVLKRKRNRYSRLSHESDIENFSFQGLYEKFDGKYGGDFEEDASVPLPQFRKIFRPVGLDMNGVFQCEINQGNNNTDEINHEINPSGVIPRSTTAEENLDGEAKLYVNDVENDDSDCKSASYTDAKEDSFELFRSPRKSPLSKEMATSILCTPTQTNAVRTLRSTKLSARRLFEKADEPQSPRTPKSTKPPKVNRTPKLNVKTLTPSRGRIQTPLRTPTTPRDKAKHALALSAAPESLPCREKEFKIVYNFVREKISSRESGVLCINGVPGSGKTATIQRVLKKLMNEVMKKKLNKFKAINVNAFDLRRSKEIYRKIYEQLSGDRKTVNIAEQLLTERFENTRKRKAFLLPIVLIIDEFDCLLSRKRDVIYKMVEWQANDNSQLVLLTIANKLDFSDEKKLFSRIKFEKLAFIAYSFQELERIIADRLQGFVRFKQEAIEFIARKVAATSGDARKALDICRQVLDTVEAEDENFSFTIDYVSHLLEQIFSNPNVRIIKQLTDLEKIALRALRDELLRTEKPFCSLWSGAWLQFEGLCNLEGFSRIESNSLLQIYAYLASIGLVKLETDHLDQHSKIWLKCDADVIHQTLTKMH